MYASEIVNEVMFQVDEEGTKIAASADTNLEENLPTSIPYYRDDNHDTNGHGVVDYFSNSFFYKPEKKLDDCYPWCGISPNVSKGYHDIIANKPFLFMIYRHKVGPLFVGKYVHPRSN